MEKEYLSFEDSDAYKLHSFQNEKKKKWYDELTIASRELAFQSEENEKWLAVFIIPTNGIDN